MNAFYRLFNLDEGLFRGGSTYTLRFTEPWAVPALALLAAAAIVVLVLVFYRYGSRRVSYPVRFFLALLRVAVVVAIFAAIFSPAFVFRTRTKDKSHVLVLVDQSSSMALRDPYDASDAEAVAKAVRAATGEAATRQDVSNMSRIDIANRVATFLRDQIAANEDFHVAVYAFAERLRVVDEGLGGGRSPIRLAANGERTEIGTALAELLKTYRGRDVSAVIVLSDGCNNAGYLVSAAADAAKERRLPVYVLGIGNPKHPKEIVVSNLLVNDTLLVNDPADLDADVAAWGYDGPDGAGEEAEIVLSEQSDGGVPVEIERKTIRLLPNGKRVSVHFEHTPREVGEKIYKVEVQPRPDEVRKDNNSESAAVSVVEAKLRVLFVTFEPTWEYRVLSRALIQDKTVHVACWLQSADPQFAQDGDESIDKLPESLDQLVRREKKEAAPAGPGTEDPAKKEYIGYDVIILAGIDPSEIKERFTESIVSFVRDHGGGLLFAAGKQMTPYALKNTRAEGLLTLLPVEIEDKHDTSNYGKRLFDEEFHLRLTSEGADLRLTQIGKSPEESRRLWEKALPGFYWYYPVRRAKPGATVIAVHERDIDLATQMRTTRKDQRPMPVIATHFFGKGRVMYVGVDETWRWRREVGDRYFYKFWSQTLHYLGKGSLLKKLGGVTITTDKSEYVVGETAVIRARVVDEATLEPSKESSFTALIGRVGSDRKPAEIPLVLMGEQGTYEGSWKTSERGTYHVWLQVEGRKIKEKPGLRKFEVQLPAQEQDDVRIDEKVLASLATQDGRFYRPSQLDQMTEIPSLVQPVAEVREVSKTETVWDSPGLLALVLGLLIVEWGVRRHKGLV